MSNGRERVLAETFVALADTLVDEFDPLEFLEMLAERCVALLDISAAAVVLADPRGRQQVAAASSETTRLLELFAVGSEEGPCVDCVATGEPVITPDLVGDSGAASRWPRFASAAESSGFRAAHALPMRLREEVVGALNLLHTQAHHLDEDATALARALADVATIGLLQERSIRRGDVLREQLQGALNSRIAVEQAKGWLAQEHGISPDEAFIALRGHARDHGLKLSELARRLVTRETDTSIVIPTPAQQPDATPG